MRVTPKTEKEIYEADLLSDGWYPFTVAKAEEKMSKKGNEMIEMSVKVYRGEGFSFVTEYLMDNEFSAKKLRHLAETCGLLAEYEDAGLPADELPGKEGWCRIGIEKSKDPRFSDKNKIWDYAKQKPESKEKQTATPTSGTTATKNHENSDRGLKAESEPPEPDDIPF